MSTINSAHMDEHSKIERNTLLITLIVCIVTGLGTFAAFAFDYTNPYSILPIFIASIIGLFFIRNGRSAVATWLVIVTSIVASTFHIWTSTGDALTRSAFEAIFIGWYGIAATPRGSRGRILLLAFITGIGLILLDIIGPQDRFVIQQSQLRIGISIVLLFTFGLVIAREFLFLDLRAKIAFGILGTGGLALGILAFFAIDRAGSLVNVLSNRLETTVQLLAEEQLVNKVEDESHSVDEFFTSTSDQIDKLTQLYINLYQEKEKLGEGTYWDATERLVEFPDGKYGNFTNDPASIFVPSFVVLDSKIVSDLNTSAYLDFAVPQALSEHPYILAIYHVNDDGVVRYYPNIRLASLLPSDFDATSRPYYKISAPLFNPQRITRWTIPYVDATGGGLVVTAAHPIYINDTFRGIIAADVQLTTLKEQIASITIGTTGYAFLLDDAGRIIYMPQAGFDLLGFNPQDFPDDDFEKQTLLGKGSSEIASIINRMVAGATALNTITINGVDYYVGYQRVNSNGYSIAIVVPVSELQSARIVTQSETSSLISSAIQTGALILTILLVVAIIFSLGLGQIIARPILRLTQTANQILEGDLTAQADVTSSDEIGTLAKAFNAMTARLRSTFEDLERIIDERTSELTLANNQNERRAKQFQSIAQVARTISSTLNFESLISQITTVISREFGFYHVGVFLLDSAKEYAVLSAANSEGGQVMLARGHRLKVGEKGLVGFVASTGRPRVALDTGVDAVYFNNPDLPKTRSEIALPLRAGKDVVGVLDVQSTEPNAFTQEDVNILSTLAEQVSIALQNARQNEETRRALAESEALSRQFVQTGWSQFTKQQNLLGVHRTAAKTMLLYDNKNATGKENAREATNQLKPKGRGAVLSLPIKLRGEVIGSVDVRAPDNRQWDQDETDIVTAIIERAAVAMENSRLLEEAQRRASREQSIGEMANTIGTFTDTEAILRATVNEIGQRIKGAKVVFELGMQDEKRSQSK